LLWLITRYRIFTPDYKADKADITAGGGGSNSNDQSTTGVSANKPKSTVKRPPEW